MGKSTLVNKLEKMGHLSTSSFTSIRSLSIFCKMPIGVIWGKHQTMTARHFTNGCDSAQGNLEEDLSKMGETVLHAMCLHYMYMEADLSKMGMTQLRVICTICHVSPLNGCD
jgi:hypothetical protein